MQPRHATDNTIRSLVVILLVGLALGLVAALVGFSDKPDVVAIGVVADPTEASSPSVSGRAESTGEPALDPMSDDEVELDELGDPILDTAETTDAPQVGAEPTATAIPIPTLAPTPEIAAAVEPAPVDDDLTGQGDASADSFELTEAAALAGTVEGAFYTRPDEDEGATVAVSTVVLTLNEDGTGSFSGELDMTLVDETHIVVDMSGPFLWSALEDPQVTAEITGTYDLDSLIDADDVNSTAGTLTITNLGTGSGSLCTPRCFGFTFPPQT